MAVHLNRKMYILQVKGVFSPENSTCLLLAAWNVCVRVCLQEYEKEYDE